MPNLIAAMKEALAKKNTSAPTSQKNKESGSKIKPETSFVANKPEKKVTARGR